MPTDKIIRCGVMWICPACQAPLQQEERRWICAQLHSYDISKEGHVNLLLANQKRSKDPGDNKQMVNARRNFLREGHYQPLATKIAQLIAQYTAVQPIQVLDAGCGEGYYLDIIIRTLTETGRDTEGAGIDVSKVAVQKAAKAYQDAKFAVASTYNIPLAEQSIDAVFQVFAPASEQEVARVLKAGGIWVQINPAAAHLTEIKSVIYQQANTHETDSSIPQGFNLVEQHRLQFEVALQKPACRENLLMMTPFYWSASETEREQIIQQLFTVTADFDLRVLSKR